MDEQVELPKQNSHMMPVAMAVIVTALLVGGGVYFWQQSSADSSNVAAMNKELAEMKEKVEQMEQEKTALEKKMASADSTMVSFDSISGYQRYVSESEEAEKFKTSTPPTGFARVKAGDKDLSIAPEGVDFFNAFVWAKADWDTGDLDDEQLFYVETVRSNPETLELVDEHAWFGPFEGKLKLLIQ